MSNIFGAEKAKPVAAKEQFVVERVPKKTSSIKKTKMDFVEALEKLAHLIPQEIIGHVNQKHTKHSNSEAIEILAECEDEILWRFREFIDQDSKGIFSALGRAELHAKLHILLAFNKKTSQRIAQLSNGDKICANDMLDDLEALHSFLSTGS